MTGSAYERITWRGVTLNRRTAAMVTQAEVVFHTIGGKGNFQAIQGSYHPGTDASGGTHDGGGAIDIGVQGPQSNWNKAEWAMRLCGGASYDRQPIPNLWGHHNHTIVIGDVQMSDAARRQVQDYYAGLDALADHAKDPHRRPNPIPVFSYPLKAVNLAHVQSEARKTRGYDALVGVKRIQRALNAKTGTHLVADGIFGPSTKAAYGRMEKQIGGNGDGIPGLFSLTLLGAARFNVK